MIDFFASAAGVPDRTISRVGRYGGIDPREVQGGFPELVDLKKNGPNEATLMGARSVYPVTGGADWICADEKHWLFADTGMKNGDGIPGLVGWEWHGDPADIPGLKVVARGKLVSRDTPGEYTATIYPGPKSNFVFNASTIFWSQGLSAPPGHMPPHSHFGRPHGPDPRVQRITRNVLERGKS